MRATTPREFRSRRERQRKRRHYHEMMQSRKKGTMFVRLADERVHFLFEWQRDTDTNRTLESLG